MAKKPTLKALKALKPKKPKIRKHSVSRHGISESGTVFDATGPGLIVYDHGVMTYCDDGNGREWHYGDDDYEDYEPF